MSCIKNNIISFFSFIFCNIFVCSYSAPTSWPMFTLPDKKIIVQNYVNINNCPPGYGKLFDHLIIPFDTLCKTFCPASWMWLVNSDNKCHHIETDFNFLKYEMIHHPNSEGGTLYSEIIAWYGNSFPYFKISFITPKEYWFCIETDSLSHTISCANDI